MLKYIISAALFAIALMGIGWRYDHMRAERLQARLKAAERQIAVEKAQTAALDKFIRSTQITRETADAAVRAVQNAEGKDTPVPPAVLDAYRRGIERLRAPPAKAPRASRQP